MGKYNHLTVLKKVKARALHHCDMCNKVISHGENYYREHIGDEFLHKLYPKKYCLSCGHKIVPNQRRMVA